MARLIHNKCFVDYVIVNKTEYTIRTYIGGKHSPWGIPWVVWIDRSDMCYTHEIEITEHTLEAAIEAHKRAIENIEQIVRDYFVSR